MVRLSNHDNYTKQVSSSILTTDNRRRERCDVKTYWVYILHCADGSYYTGVTNDLDRRVFEHQSGAIPGSFTHTRRPISLVYSEDTNDICAAIEREKQIKGWSRKKKEALILHHNTTLPMLSKRRTPQKPGYHKLSW